MIIHNCLSYYLFSSLLSQYACLIYVWHNCSFTNQKLAFIFAAFSFNDFLLFLINYNLVNLNLEKIIQVGEGSLVISVLKFSVL